MSAPAITAYRAVVPFETNDGSIIRELMHPQVHGNRMQSLAEAIVPPQSRTLLHRHHLSEELYHVTGGSGRLRFGEHECPVSVGVTVCIAPGTPLALINPGDTELRLLCASAPAYAHDDTEMLAGTEYAGLPQRSRARIGLPRVSK